MKLSAREIPGLEFHLLRRSVDALSEGRERCDHCHRTPLVGERVHIYKSDRMLCELCRALRPEEPLSSRLVHGPAFGHAVRITDQRATRRAKAAGEAESESESE
ncbi:MAG: hypothetical protein QOJ25_2577 [Solirubrobacteraceae bacterium]|jgi:hypothetical protein|nr:hypothetical protein [Solirubrobacteraceae bacterium]